MLGVGVAEKAAVAVGVFEVAEGIVAGGVVAVAAGEIAGGVFFRGALGASVDVEEEEGVAGVDELLRDVEVVEGVGLGGVVELVDDGDDLVVGGVFVGDEGDGVVGLVEEFEGWWWGCGAGWVFRRFDLDDSGSFRFAAGQ